MYDDVSVQRYLFSGHILCERQRAGFFDVFIAFSDSYDPHVMFISV